MRNNSFVKLLCSIPVILAFIYFIPFLGICLLFLRCFVYNNRKKTSTPIYLIGFGILILLPKGMQYVFDMIKFDVNSFPYYTDIINSDLYLSNFINYSKTLITLGIIYVIISTIFTSIYNKVTSKVSTGLRNYMQQDLQKDYEIRKENDLKMQEKREISKNTHVVRCPYCGSDNMLTEQTGTCKFCRRKIEFK